MEADEILGYRFVQPALLEEALTAPAYKMDNPSAKDNQRLEFLGDAVLGFLSAERLFGEFPLDSEGPLTVKRTHMVSAAALCEAAARIDLASRLRRNRHATPLPPQSKTLADAVEAIVGAAYLDGGLAAAREIFAALELKAETETAAWGGNPKGELQIRVQAMKPPRHPVYTLLNTAGKAHDPVFTVSVSVEGVGEETASAHNHKEAETLAAARLLERMEKCS